MKLGKLYREEVAHWRITEAQCALLMAFVYCLELRANGIDFDRHWDAMCGEDRAEFEGRDYGICA